jgi:hypothetical protein
MTHGKQQGKNNSQYSWHGQPFIQAIQNSPGGGSVGHD